MYVYIWLLNMIVKHETWSCKLIAAIDPYVW